MTRANEPSERSDLALSKLSLRALIKFRRASRYISLTNRAGFYSIEFEFRSD
jgi:hypothetical protein